MAFAALLALPGAWLIIPAAGFDVSQELLGAIPDLGSSAVETEPSFSRVNDFQHFASPSETHPEGLESSGSFFGILVAVLWCGVALVLLLRTIFDHLAVRRLFARSYVAVGVVARHPPVSIRVSPDVAVPVAGGWWRPFILLPAEALRWEDARLQAVLSHETAHAVRRDPITSTGASIACALYWFNPLVWRARASLERECEKACDDQAIRLGADPCQYAETLLASARDSLPLRRSGALLGMAGCRDVEERLRSILDHDRIRMEASGGLIARSALFGCVLALCVGGLRPAPAHSSSEALSTDEAFAAASSATSLSEQAPATSIEALPWTQPPPGTLANRKPAGGLATPDHSKSLTGKNWIAPVAPSRTSASSDPHAQLGQAPANWAGPNVQLPTGPKTSVRPDIRLSFTQKVSVSPQLTLALPLNGPRRAAEGSNEVVETQSTYPTVQAAVPHPAGESS
jgi:hypothetical protein